MKRLFTICLLPCFLLLHSCGDGTIATKPSDIVFPDSNVSYQSHVQPFLNLTCAFSGCHADGTRIPLTSYIGLYQTPGLLIVGKPESSTLTQVLNGILPHNNSFQRVVTDNHKAGMTRWVRDGAKNN
ncbi:MAG: hypothetical protein JNL32_07435 [Candidatus Kapabacteria bacterium]|nr:hypothetical protein [Candidatus Kapabacteria bacterium]